MLFLTRTSSVKTLAEIYTAADFFCNPTHEDNYPTTNLEAQACGTWVITYDVGGSKETLQ
jgi:putative colanic acid biosynthesis glycosyltransferase